MQLSFGVRPVSIMKVRWEGSLGYTTRAKRFGQTGPPSSKVLVAELKKQRNESYGGCKPQSHVEEH